MKVGVELKNLNKLLGEIEILAKAQELLDEVWIELGPYNAVLSDELTHKLRDYFHHDDSE